MHAIDDLPHRPRQLRGGGAAAKIVHALKEDDVRHTGPLQHVAIEPLQQRRAVAPAGNDAIPRDARGNAAASSATSRPATLIAVRIPDVRQESSMDGRYFRGLTAFPIRSVSLNS
jgi:hypothetical protein